MSMLRHLQHGLGGQGPQLRTVEFTPETHAIRLWADTFPSEQGSQRVIQGEKLGQFKIVNAYDPTMAPIIKGKSNCPASSTSQFISHSTLSRHLP